MSESSSQSSPEPSDRPSASLYLKALLRQVFRITVTDGRIFIGSFVGTDQPLNILLVNTEEFRTGPGENQRGRYVGQVMIPWKLVVKAEAQAKGLKDVGNGRHEEAEDTLYT